MQKVYQKKYKKVYQRKKTIFAKSITFNGPFGSTHCWDMRALRAWECVRVRVSVYACECVCKCVWVRVRVSERWRENEKAVFIRYFFPFMNDYFILEDL